MSARTGGYIVFVGRMNAENGASAVRIARLARRKPVMITKIREPEQWRYYTEQVRPLMGADDPEPREEPLAPRVELVRHGDAPDRIATIDHRVRHQTVQRRFDRPRMARDHERLYRCILTGERTTRAMLPTPVA